MSSTLQMQGLEVNIQTLQGQFHRYGRYIQSHSFFETLI